jgi:hypothetical protein
MRLYKDHCNFGGLFLKRTEKMKSSKNGQEVEMYGQNEPQML